MSLSFCRCGGAQVGACALCKSPLCFWHTTDRYEQVQTADGGRTSERQTVCFPSCTSSFGLPEAAAPKPRSRA